MIGFIELLSLTVAAAMAMTNKFSVLSITTLILAAVAESGRNDLRLVTNISGAACPGNLLTYECDITGPGNTIWNGTAFYCPSKSNEIILRHSQFSTESGTSGSCNDRTLIEVRSVGVINNCFSSQLNITITSDLKNKTIRCSHSSAKIVAIGEVQVPVATVPCPSPSNVRLAEVRTGELIFSWEESIDCPSGLDYIINSTCGTCPNISSATMATCSDLDVSTTLTTCTFSVQSMACGTIGVSSFPVVVTLAVPDIPEAVIIPQYSQNNGQLIAIIVRVIQNVASFSISDAGSTTSYHILSSSGSSIDSQPACMKDTCEYEFDLPPPDCSGSSVDIAVASANKLGLGPPSEPITIECNNRFVKVEYDPSTTTISCMFENESDLSEKLCSIRYGPCGKEANSVKKGTIEGPSFAVTLKLSSIATNSKYCYVVTARLSNDTLTVMVNGSFETQSSNNMDVIIGAVIGVIIVLVSGIAMIVIVVCFVVRKYSATDRYPSDAHVKMSELNNSSSQQNLVATVTADQNDAKADDITVSDDFEVMDENVYKDYLIKIKSVPFKEFTVPSDCKLDDLKPELGEFIFVDYKCHSSKKIIDIMLKDKSGQWFSAPDGISQVQRDSWEKVFILLNQREVFLKKDEVILHQDSNQLKKMLKFRVFDVNEDDGQGPKLSEFLVQLKMDKFDYARAYYEFSDGKLDLLYYREVVEVSNSKLEEAKSTGNGYIILESSTGRGIHMFYKLKPQAPGVKISPPNVKNGRCFVQSTPQDSDRCLKVGSLVLYEENVDPESHRNV